MNWFIWNRNRIVKFYWILSFVFQCILPWMRFVPAWWNGFLFEMLQIWNETRIKLSIWMQSDWCDEIDMKIHIMNYIAESIRIVNSFWYSFYKLCWWHKIDLNFVGLILLWNKANSTGFIPSWFLIVSEALFCNKIFTIDIGRSNLIDSWSGVFPSPSLGLIWTPSWISNSTISSDLINDATCNGVFERWSTALMFMPSLIKLFTTWIRL